MGSAARVLAHQKSVRALATKNCQYLIASTNRTNITGVLGFAVLRFLAVGNRKWEIGLGI